ncbi:MAG: hypothetical protein ABI597_11245 [Gammaproteobacteria bacterium]
MLSKLRNSMFRSKQDTLLENTPELALSTPEEKRLIAIKRNLERSINPQGVCEKATNVSNRFYPPSLTKIKTGLVAWSDLIILSAATGLIEYDISHDSNPGASVGKGFAATGGAALLFCYSFFRYYQPYADLKTQLPLWPSDQEFLKTQGINLCYDQAEVMKKDAGHIVAEINSILEQLRMAPPSAKNDDCRSSMCTP